MEEVEVGLSKKQIRESYVGAVGFGLLGLMLVASLIMGAVKKNKSSNMVEKSKIELVNKANQGSMGR